MTKTIRLHHIMEHSTVNGPNNRFVIWTQGCPFHCDGCFNQLTHSQTGGFEMNIQDLADKISQTKDIRGIKKTKRKNKLCFRTTKSFSKIRNRIYSIFNRI